MITVAEKVSIINITAGQSHMMYTALLASSLS